MAVEVIRRFVDATCPAVPTGLAVGSFTSTSIPLTWNTNSETDFLAFILERSTDDVNWGFVTTTPTTSYTDMVSGFNYYRLRSQDKTGNISSPSTSVSGGIPTEYLPSRGIVRFTSVEPTAYRFTARLENYDFGHVTATPIMIFGISLRTDGILYRKAGNIDSAYTADSNEWNISSANVSEYEVMVTILSGASPTSSPAVDTWHALSSNRTWTWATATNVTQTLNAQFSIRHAASGIVVTTKTTTGTYHAT